jgi:hypothetical protein
LALAGSGTAFGLFAHAVGAERVSPAVVVAGLLAGTAAVLAAAAGLLAARRTDRASGTRRSSVAALPAEPPPPASGLAGGRAPDPRAPAAAECVRLFDEVDRARARLEPGAGELADHVLERLREVLVLAGAEVIEGEPAFDRGRHQSVDGRGETGDPVHETVSPGFAMDGRVLRRARVQLGAPRG